jgi:aminoglycoside phosphotransferase
MRIPELLAFEAGADGGEDRLLTAEVPGRDLTHLVDDPARVVRMLADALLKLHSAPIDLLGVVEEGGGGRSNLVIVHGDACLPNILVDDAGERPIGLVDVGDMRIGRAEEDLAAACWSIGFNIGIEWGGAFLGHYDWPHTDQDTVQALADAYGT